LALPLLLAAATGAGDEAGALSDSNTGGFEISEIERLLADFVEAFNYNTFR